MQRRHAFTPNIFRIGKGRSIPVTYLFYVLYTFTTVLLFLYHQQLFFDAWADENINLYVARAVADGLTLYGDIPSARPPMAIFPVAVLIKMGLSPLGAGRTIVFLTIVVTGIVLWFLGKKIWGEWAGLTASLLFILGPAVAYRTTFTGIELVSLWCLLTVGFILLRRPWWSGLFAAVAIATGQHSAILVGATFVLSILLLGKRCYRFVFPFLGVSAFIFIFVYLIGGHDFFQYLVERHLYHVSDSIQVAKGNFNWGMKIWLRENLYLLLLILFSLGREIWGRRFSGTREFLDYVVKLPLLNYLRDPAWVILILALGHLLVVFTMKGAVTFYVYPVIPLLALVAGRGAVHLSQGRSSAETPKSKKISKRSRQKPVKTKNTLPLGVGLMWGCVIIFSLIGFKSASMLYGQRSFIRYSFWPHFRLLTERQYRRPLVASQISEDLGPKTDRNTRETIFGDAIIASLVGLKTGRRVAANLADIDPVWFQLGILSREDIVKKIEKDFVTYVIIGNWHNATDIYFKNYMIKCYEPPKEFPQLPNSTIPPLFVFRHRDNRPCLP
jgi:hypothetical protein